MNAATTTQATAAHYNDCLPPELQRYARGHEWDSARQDIEVHGVTISDYSLPNRFDSTAAPAESVWVGIDGEGRWMNAGELLAVSQALAAVAQAHIARLAALKPKERDTREIAFAGPYLPSRHGASFRDIRSDYYTAGITPCWQSVHMDAPANMPCGAHRSWDYGTDLGVEPCVHAHGFGIWRDL